jgi:RNA polymerase sigma-70 factor (ECF subfamily)
MERHAGGVINLACRFLGSVADAEEIAQEVFLKLYQRPPKLLPTTKLFTWLYRVTANLCIDALRRKPGRSKLISLDAPALEDEKEELPLAERIAGPSAGSPRDQVAQAEVSQLVRREVEALPLALRAPIVLSTFQELSQEAIAQALGLTPKAVERRLSRARSILKERLRPHL